MPFEERRQQILLGLDHEAQAQFPSHSAPQSSTGVTPSTLIPVEPALQATTECDTRVSMKLPLSDWTPETLVKQNSRNFKHVPRISASLPTADLLLQVREHEESGVPLIIEGWHEKSNWDDDVFSVHGFVGNDELIVDVRNLRETRDVKMPLSKLVQIYEDAGSSEKPNGSVYYGKDLPCPDKWTEWLKTGLPEYLHPFGDNDMFSHLQPNERPETLMCYLGIEDTLTKAHKDPCGSFGHNLMCHTSRGGSAFWFMTATGEIEKDEPTVYFHEELGSELDLESHTATVSEFGAAPFHVYIAEQKLGDLVLVPPRSCHQVVNRGGITIKMSWSRMGMKSLECSLYSELALYHRVCRQETYRVKLTVFASVKAFAQRLASIDTLNNNAAMSSLCQAEDYARILGDLKILVRFLDEILAEEWTPDHQKLKYLSRLPSTPAEADQYRHVCDFCGADIFQSFFSCSKCADGPEFTCCPACYVEGRSCQCGLESMEPLQSWPFTDLISERNKAVDILNNCISSTEQIPQCTVSFLESSQRLQVFRAACILQSKAKRLVEGRRTTYRCNTRTDKIPSHDEAPVRILQCRWCRSGICYEHILRLYNTHVAEALIEASLDDDHNNWHAMHLSRASKLKRKSITMEESQKPGELGGLQSSSKRMLWVATTFRTCRPVDFNRCKLGFYDHPLTVVDPPIEVQTVAVPCQSNLDHAVSGILPYSWSSLSSLSELDSDNHSTVSEDESVENPENQSLQGTTIIVRRQNKEQAASPSSIGMPFTPSRRKVEVLVPFLPPSKKARHTDRLSSPSPPIKSRASLSSSPVNMLSSHSMIPAFAPRKVVEMNIGISDSKKQTASSDTATSINSSQPKFPGKGRNSVGGPSHTFERFSGALSRNVESLLSSDEEDTPIVLRSKDTAVSKQKSKTATSRDFSVPPRPKESSLGTSFPLHPEPASCRPRKALPNFKKKTKESSRPIEPSTIPGPMSSAPVTGPSPVTVVPDLSGNAMVTNRNVVEQRRGDIVQTQMDAAYAKIAKLEEEISYRNINELRARIHMLENSNAELVAAREVYMQEKQELLWKNHGLERRCEELESQFKYRPNTWGRGGYHQYGMGGRGTGQPLPQRYQNDVRHRGGYGHTSGQQQDNSAPIYHAGPSYPSRVYNNHGYRGRADKQWHHHHRPAQPGIHESPIRGRWSTASSASFSASRQPPEAPFTSRESDGGWGAFDRSYNEPTTTLRAEYPSPHGSHDNDWSRASTSEQRKSAPELFDCSNNGSVQADKGALDDKDMEINSELDVTVQRQRQEWHSHFQTKQLRFT